MRKSQSSTEVLAIIAISMLLLFPALVLFTNFIQESTFEVVNSRVDSIGNAMIENAQSIYPYGEGARIVAKFDFPPSINNTYIENNNYIIFQIEGKGGMSDLLFYSEVALNATFTEEDFNKGTKFFKFEVMEGGDVVLIEKQ